MSLVLLLTCGIALNWIVTSLLADNIANWATKKNRGIREPEMRLPACAIAVVLTFFGALIASLTYQAHTHWAGPIVGFGVLSAGAQMGATLAMAYSLDCHKEVCFYFK